MSDTAGSISWIDLTVADAPAIRDFYQSVTGWTPSPVDMGGYDDFCMTPPGATAPVSGICHARGPNADLPPVWMVYIRVDDLDASVRRVTELGGHLRRPVDKLGPSGRFCVIQDPAGAFAALYEEKPET